MKIETNIDDLKINFIKKGNGKKVLIIPGWGTTIETYKTIIDSVSKNMMVYCLDMPGFGKSQEPNEGWNVDKYVDFINKFIENQRIKELSLIGHSNGGRIIIKLMNKKNLKFKINKIILIGSAGIVHKKKLKQKLKIKIFKISKKILNKKIIKKLFPNLIFKFQNKFGSEDYKNATKVMRETLVKLVNEDLRDYLKNINIPTILLWGENDTATPIEDGILMEKMIPDSALIKIKNCTHYVFLENPEYVNLIINTFLKGENK